MSDTDNITKKICSEDETAVTTDTKDAHGQEQQQEQQECNDDASPIVDQYLKAIDMSDYSESYPQSFEYLCELQKRHLDTFPFSSVEPRLGNKKYLSLDIKALLDTLVIKKRGGYCFQQNKLFFVVLKHLGYQVRLVLGRVTNNKNVRPGLTHRFTIVDFGSSSNNKEGCNSFLVDVSFGSKCPTGPVPLERGSELVDPDFQRKFRVHYHPTDPDPLHLQVFMPLDEDWFTTYKFTLNTSYCEADSEVGHFYSYQHPDAIFVNHLVVSKRQQSEEKNDVMIVQLHNLSLKYVSPFDGQTIQQETIQSSTEMQRILQDTFDIYVNEEESRQLFAKSQDYLSGL
mmetsp:Transcript_8973/g.13791  ORF Transcript_8973/g.13791 Transcript_8973/m.13791 type:complete len:342 (+) Transcript_8973:84-1109(+)